MNLTFSITAEQISKLHNAYWMLNDEVTQLEEALNSSKITSLRKGLSILKDAYLPLSEAKDIEWDRRNTYFETVREANKFKSVWSIYEVGILQACSGLEGKVLKYGRVSIPLRQDVKLYCLTWIYLWECAEQAIKESGDGHHIFIEGFKDRGDGVIELITGS